MSTHASMRTFSIIIIGIILITAIITISFIIKTVITVTAIIIILLHLPSVPGEFLELFVKLEAATRGLEEAGEEDRDAGLPDDEDRDAGLPDDAGLDEALALHRESLLVLLGDGHHRAALIAQFPEDARRHDSSGSCSYSCCRPRSRTFPPCMLPGEVPHPQSLHEGLEVLALGQLELSGNLVINN